MGKTNPAILEGGRKGELRVDGCRGGRRGEKEKWHLQPIRADAARNLPPWRLNTLDILFAVFSLISVLEKH